MVMNTVLFEIIVQLLWNKIINYNKKERFVRKNENYFVIYTKSMISVSFRQPLLSYPCITSGFKSQELFIFRRNIKVYGEIP